MEGYKCDFCDEFQEYEDSDVSHSKEPFAIIRTNGIYQGDKEEEYRIHWGLSLDVCFGCWPRLEKFMIDMQEEMEKERVVL